MTKAYKEPTAKKSKFGATPLSQVKEFSIDATTTSTGTKSPTKSKIKKIKRTKGRPRYTVLDSGRISVRKSTVLKSAATQHRVKERTAAKNKKTKRYRDNYIPTQDELLEEAVITAEENLVYLGMKLIVSYCFLNYKIM